ncbi:mediator of RNA polymerase II transcription subunit 6-like [Montipora capricornis]|uniref:mediator of RNA polymerase II transcription subunit 6-like n=1 Tax=Montipora capricornis TaxID=246305 RepID=UPI0035F212FE
MAAESAESQLGLSWHDSAWIPVLNRGNVLEYFSQRTNPFYDRTCNNEVVKMQRLDPSTLQTMTGIEYEVLHVQEPILYVIRKQHRISPTQVTPIADYYVLAGVVYQAPDLCSVINSRLLSALHHIQAAFSEASSYSRYHPSKGYWWQFKEKQQQKLNGAKDKNNEKTKSTKDPNSEPSSLFQREGVHFLLGELSKKFPPQFLQQGQAFPGQAKKNGEKPSSEEIGSKGGQATEASSIEQVPNGTTVPGGLVTNLSRGLPSSNQSIKRSAGGDSKQPPGKRKKV